MIFTDCLTFRSSIKWSLSINLSYTHVVLFIYYHKNGQLRSTLLLFECLKNVSINETYSKILPCTGSYKSKCLRNLPMILVWIECLAIFQPKQSGLRSRYFALKLAENELSAYLYQKNRLKKLKIFKFH